jgi:hypothetical protein
MTILSIGELTSRQRNFTLSLGARDLRMIVPIQSLMLCEESLGYHILCCPYQTKKISGKVYLPDVWTQSICFYLFLSFNFLMLFKCSIIIYFYKDVSKSCIPPTMDLLIIFTNHDDSLPHNEETKSYLSDIIYKVIFYFQTLIFLILQKNYFISIYFFYLYRYEGV